MCSQELFEILTCFKEIPRELKNIVFSNIACGLAVDNPDLFIYYASIYPGDFAKVPKDANQLSKPSTSTYRMPHEKEKHLAAKPLQYDKFE